jgi:hypothetical protein
MVQQLTKGEVGIFMQFLVGESPGALITAKELDFIVKRLNEGVDSNTHQTRASLKSWIKKTATRFEVVKCLLQGAKCLSFTDGEIVLTWTVPGGYERKTFEV